METSKAVNLLSIGLLDQFSSLKELEVLLTQLLGKQNEMLENELKNLSFEQLNEGKEVSMMMKKMNLYRLKLRNLRCEMLYIHQRAEILKKKCLNIQSMKADEKAAKVRGIDYEEGLIAKYKT